jgi:hypothetical protein
MEREITTLQQGMVQLKANQEQMVREIAKLTEQNARRRAPTSAASPALSPGLAPRQAGAAVASHRAAAPHAFVRSRAAATCCAAASATAATAGPTGLSRAAAASLGALRTFAPSIAR